MLAAREPAVMTRGKVKDEVPDPSCREKGQEQSKGYSFTVNLKLFVMVHPLEQSHATTTDRALVLVFGGSEGRRLT